MRTLSVPKSWEKVFNRNYDHSLISINLNGARGITNIEFNKGIFAICGLNGAGKSTIVASLKDVLGIEISKQDMNKIMGKSIEAKIGNKTEEFNVSNLSGNRFTDLIDKNNAVKYIDYKQSTIILDHLEQANLEEYLDQFETIFLDTSEIGKINYIVEKSYDQITLTEIEDGENTIPYFKVKIANLEYDSLAMGIGEHFLFYIFWVLYRIEKNGIILIEEPETFIGVNSQKKLMNYIAVKAGDIGSTVVVSTHSPFIVKNIKKENIIVLSRFLENVSIMKPTDETDTLTSLGLVLPKRGCIYVEDRVAELFLITLLQKHTSNILMNFDFEIAHGSAQITKRLEFPFSTKFQYKIIGIYDGDMKEQIMKEKEKLNWNFSFLPIEPSVEEQVISCLRFHVLDFAKLINIDIQNITALLARIQGEDHHDFFINLCRGLNKDMAQILIAFYDIWIDIPGNREVVNEFIQTIETFCD